MTKLQMQLIRENYCDECWLIVSGKNKEGHSDNEASKHLTTKELKSDTVGKSPEIGVAGYGIKKVASKVVTSTVESKVEKPTLSQNNLTDRKAEDKNYVIFNGEKPPRASTEMSVQKSNTSKMKFSMCSGTILKTETVILDGALPSDSDLCSECLIKYYRDSFEKNILKNVYGSLEESHNCRMVSVQKDRKGYMQLCGDIECPTTKFWKILNSGGSGWKVDSAGCFPPQNEFGGSSCFTTSSGLCSKEQLVELSQVGLSPRVMDEVRPHFEVSEWYCGQGYSTSRYGYKVSLLDSRQLMMCVHGECKTLEPFETSTWRKVTYTFRDYEPGVRYVLFHHAGQGEVVSGREREEGWAHPGCKMAGASIVAKLPFCGIAP